MRVFLDTNVLVSAFLSRGLCADLLRIVLRDHDLVVSQLVLMEFERVLRDKLCASEPDLKLAMTVFDSVEVLADPSTLRMDPALASSDAAILAAAIGGGVDIFVTGDREVLTAAGRVPLLVVSPRRFMELLNQAASDPYPEPADSSDEPKVSEDLPQELRSEAFEFALQLVARCRSFESRENAFLAQQLLCAGVRLGVLLEEAAGMGSSPQTGRAIDLARQAAREAEYWLRLLIASGPLSDDDVQPLLRQSRELIQRLSTVRTRVSSVDPWLTQP